MLSTHKLQLSSPLLDSINPCQLTAGNLVSHRGFSFRLPLRQSASLTALSENVSSSVPLVSSDLNSAVGSSSAPQLSSWTLTHRHINILCFIACTAFRRAAESLEKLMDVTKEELPDTMAAVRLSGMEISDLTMELSDVGQGLTQGIRSSTRAVRLAEERLRQFSSRPQSGSTSPNGDQDSRTSFS
ncbi:unnamed protein product [Withania somnifera]